MQKEDFILLSITRKIGMLWDQGEVIAERSYYECQITLFLFEDYFVEVFFNREKNEIIGIELQDNQQILYCYVNDIDLSQLTNLLH